MYIYIYMSIVDSSSHVVTENDLKYKRQGL